MNEGGFSGRVVVFCHLQQRGSVLLIRRAAHPHYNLVTIPGGRKEPLETVHAACMREMKEETGLDVVCPLLAGVVSVISAASGQETLCFYFTARSFSGRLCSSPEGEVFWSSVPESYGLPDISPFYRLVAPFLEGRKGSLFVGMVKMGPKGQIESHDLHLQ